MRGIENNIYETDIYCTSWFQNENHCAYQYFTLLQSARGVSHRMCGRVYVGIKR